GREQEREARRLVRPPAGRAETGVRQLGLDAFPPELGAHLDPETLSLGKGELDLELAHVHLMSRERPETDVHPLVLRRPVRVEGEPLLREVGLELTIRVRQAIPNELLRYPLRVVVGTLDDGRILHEVDAEEEGITGCDDRGNRSEERCPARRVEVADRAS